jgi:photosystem II stability/assembly factor-like uncharacterized protein
MDPGDHTHLVIQQHQGNGCATVPVDGGLTGTCLAESTDSGGTWKLLTLPTGWGEDSTTVILNRTTWLSTCSGMWLTTDEGVTWKLLNTDYASANYYQSYVWQDADGHYYVPSTTCCGPNGLLQSPPNDASSWSQVTNSPQGTVMFPTSTQLVYSDMFDNAVEAGTSGSYWIASQHSPTAWSSFEGPPTGPPTKGALGGAGAFMAYDKVHHVLYMSTFATGLWETVIE